MELRELILGLVDCAIKHNELVVNIIVLREAAEQKPAKCDPSKTARDIEVTLEELVNQGELVEVEYTLPDSNYKVRSMYFPKGTDIISIRNQATPKASLEIDDSKIRLIKKGEPL